ncbi:hypothetical protein [Roseibium marinum]|uniref:Uncharacterized protein n=1 Tax=Roseibium marinum TaxID=281252 RepID=A0A2S3UQ55_9HYPH|nr:hypothetical protein [Roseibium marinum]POF29673.1 hypothetical protein CLV41_10896 [Roseibium marinum]
MFAALDMTTANMKGGEQERMDNNELTQTELLKRLGERVALLARMQSEAARLLSERAAGFFGLQERLAKEFNRASDLTQKLAERLDARLKARMAN